MDGGSNTILFVNRTELSWTIVLKAVPILHTSPWSVLATVDVFIITS